MTNFPIHKNEDDQGQVIKTSMKHKNMTFGTIVIPTTGTDLPKHAATVGHSL